jgi:hypothetical protein
VLLREIGRGAARLLVQYEINAALAIQGDSLRLVAGDGLKAKQLENRLDSARFRGGELDKFETVEPHWVCKLFGHGRVLIAIKDFSAVCACFMDIVFKNIYSIAILEIIISIFGKNREINS